MAQNTESNKTDSFHLKTPSNLPLAGMVIATLLICFAILRIGLILISDDYIGSRFNYMSAIDLQMSILFVMLLYLFNTYASNYNTLNIKVLITIYAILTVLSTILMAIISFVGFYYNSGWNAINNVLSYVIYAMIYILSIIIGIKLLLFRGDKIGGLLISGILFIIFSIFSISMSVINNFFSTSILNDGAIDIIVFFKYVRIAYTIRDIGLVAALGFVFYNAWLYTKQSRITR